MFYDMFFLPHFALVPDVFHLLREIGAWREAEGKISKIKLKLTIISKH